MKVLCVVGRYNYGTKTRGDGIEFINFVPALRRLGHEVEVFDNTDRSLYDSFPALNEAFLLKVEQFQPEVVLAVQMLYEIWGETWDIIRKTGRTRVVNWATDDSWKYWQFSRFLSPHFDAFATTYSDRLKAYLQDGYDSAVLTQWAASGVTLRPPSPASRCIYPVTFVGSCYGRRGEFIRFLQEKNIEVRCFGHGWPGGAIDSSAIPGIVSNSVISLNFSGSGAMLERFRPSHRQVKARIFEIPGMGGFLLTEWAPSLNQFYDLQAEIGTFRNKYQLLERIRFYLENPDERDRMALAAYQRTCKEHTYESRMENLLKFVIDRPQAPTEPPTGIDWDRFHRASQSHTCSATLHRVKAIVVFICSMIFGEVRGPRAARRLLFELSWRISGQATYSSRGLPGRLFYRES